MQQFQEAIPEINPQKSQQQSKATIYIENLDLGISDLYLYKIFKEVGKIQSLKILKNRITQQSKGKAFITFVHPESAEVAIQKFNNQVLIRNNIRVKPFFQFQITDQKAKILIENLPEDVDSQELEDQFSRFGTVLSVDVHRDQTGKLLNFGYIQFQRYQDAEKLIRSIQTHPVTHKGKILKFEQFKIKSERNEKPSIFLKEFAAPLPQELINQITAIRSIEYGWSLVIKDYLTRVQGDQVTQCFVKIGTVTRQPWAMISFETLDQAKANLDICEKLRKHPCFISNAHKAFELIKKHWPPPKDGDLEFTIQQIEPLFEQLSKDPSDPFKGESDNFFFIIANKKPSDPDERQIIIQNIKEDTTKEQISQFLEQFGKVIHLKMNKTTKFQDQQCSVYYQTLEDSKRARQKLQDKSDEKINKQKNEIFKNDHVVVQLLLSNNKSQEVMDIKKQSQNISVNPAGIEQLPLLIPIPPQQGSSTVIQQPTFLQEFMDYKTVQCRMNDFLKIHTDAQRQVLGNLLFQQVFDVIKDKESSKQIASMLIDSPQFVIQDYLNLLDNANELQSFIDKGILLIHNEQKAN